MFEIPKIVRQRLNQPGSASSNHPDANLLGAFGEGCLTGPERTTVLDHLSFCAECREVVALALPPVESLQPALQFSSGRKLTWPILRWGFTSAGVLALALFGFVEYGHHADSVRMAKNSVPAAAMQGREEPVPAAPARDEMRANEERSQRAATASATVEKDRTETSAKTELAKSFSAPAVRGPLVHGPRQTDQFQQQNAQRLQSPARLQIVPETKQAGAPPTASGISGASEMAEVHSESAQLDVLSPATDSLVATNKPQPVPPGASDGEVSRAKSAPAAVAAQAAPSALETQGRTFQALNLITPTWMVNSGRLQRSSDQGQSWQDVNVTASVDTGVSLEVAIASNKAPRTRKDKKGISTAPVFRAVAANGPDVWAGGTAAALYHSLDAGAHWARVIPSSDSGTLSGDILSMEFPDAQNGRISTSTGEVWTTTDSGESWKKQ
jgi:hypothetical protein